MLYILALALILIAGFKIPPHWSMALGIFMALTLPFSDDLQKKSKAWGGKILQYSIVLLGAGLNFHVVLKEGLSGAVVTFISISSVLIIGHFLARLFKVESPLSTLITVGTSICGGSAISAVSGVIKADNFSMATSLGIVFLLNGISVFIFTGLGHYFGLNEVQFGTWAALAIHDTSSVVAASSQYGARALEVGTTLKLTRALWIIPLTLWFAMKEKKQGAITIPWFILLFMANSLLFTFVEQISNVIPYFTATSKVGFSITLFLIGLSLNKAQLKTMKLNSLFFGITLWLITLVLSLVYVYHFVRV